MRLRRLTLMAWICLALLGGCGTSRDQVVQQMAEDLAVEEIKPFSITLAGADQAATLRIELPAPADRGGDLLAVAGYAADLMREQPWLAGLDISETDTVGETRPVASIKRSDLLDWSGGKLSDAEFRARWTR